MQCSNMLTANCHSAGSFVTRRGFNTCSIWLCVNGSADTDAPRTSRGIASESTEAPKLASTARLSGWVELSRNRPEHLSGISIATAEPLSFCGVIVSLLSDLCQNQDDLV